MFSAFFSVTPANKVKKRDNWIIFMTVYCFHGLFAVPKRIIDYLHRQHLLSAVTDLVCPTVCLNDVVSYLKI